ncbi:MAG: hypothetical protein HYU51_02860 [Candidatus Rokubacteria bacterium]|nr:hypothetical protein [Candidatus Rokubacteria bacterium]
MARSRTGGRRSAAARPSVPESAPSAVGDAPIPSLASATLPRVWQGVGYRPLAEPGPARRLFDFAAVPWPACEALALAWGASHDDRLVGAIVGERARSSTVRAADSGVALGTSMFLHGPVVVTDRDPIEVAAQLVTAALDHARALGVETLFARPLALDRLWVRFGFIPTPESALPPSLAGRPGSGLYAWRGGSALWTFRDIPRD